MTQKLKPTKHDYGYKMSTGIKKKSHFDDLFIKPPNRVYPKAYKQLVANDYSKYSISELAKRYDVNISNVQRWVKEFYTLEHRK